MATSGVNAGASMIDVESIVSQLMQIEKRPVNKIETKIANKSVEISALGALKSRASALEAALSAIENPASYNAKSVSSSDSAAVVAEVTSSASAGDIDLKVVTTARSTRLAVNGFASGSASVGNGTLTLEVGAYSTSNNATTFSASTTKSISVPQGATLSDLRDLINQSGLDVNANIVKTASTYSLVIGSTKTGTDNALRVSTSGTQNFPGGDAPDLTSLAYSAGTGDTSNATLLQSAQNALVYVDGLRVERSSNTIDNAVPGVTFNLKKQASLSDVSQAQPISISVSEQAGQVKSVLGNLVSAYNDFMQTYKSLTAASSDPSKRGVLNSDSTASSLVSRVRQMLFSEGISYSETDGNGLATTSTLLLSELGVELQRDGSLKMNETKFSAAVEDGTAAKLSTGATISAQAFLNTAVATGGLFDERANGVLEAQTALQKRKTDLEDMLTRKETSLRKTYAVLDATLFKLNNINNSLQLTLDAITAQQNND